MHDILNATQAAKVIGCCWGEVVQKGKSGIWPFVKVISRLKSLEEKKTATRYQKGIWQIISRFHLKK